MNPRPGTCGACPYYIPDPMYGGKCGRIESIYAGTHRSEREKDCRKRSNKEGGKE